MGHFLGRQNHIEQKVERMTHLPTKGDAPDVPAQVYEAFLQALQDAGLSSELISNLRSTLIHNKTYTEQALKKAILGEEPPK